MKKIVLSFGCVLFVIFLVAMIGLFKRDADRRDAEKAEILSEFDVNQNNILDGKEAFKALKFWGLSGDQMVKMVQSVEQQQQYLNNIPKDQRNNQIIAKETLNWLAEGPHSYVSLYTDFRLRIIKKIADQNGDGIISKEEAEEVWKFLSEDPLELKSNAIIASH